MKSNKFRTLLLSSIAFGAVALTTGCRDDYAELNQDPSAVTEGNISYLFAEAVNKFDPQPYLEYYYNAPMKYQWSGMGISTGGASESILTLTADGDQAEQYINVLRVLRAMENEWATLDEENQAYNEGYIEAAKVLSIYEGIFATDMYGSIPYNEACMAAYGGTMTPAYDTVESLYSQWCDELDEAVSVFTNGKIVMSSTQDVVYGGDGAKWAKLANSLKLRIAVRLLANDATKAKQIAAAVESASCGYIDDVDDDFRFCKGTAFLSGDDEGYVNDRVYHWSNGFTGCAGRQAVINFMVNNQDPRVRFFYKKNSWNSKIVQGYYDAGLEIPDFIEQNVNYTVDANGKKHFESWGGLGEPWVRYYGMTEDWMASNDNSGKYKWYFPSSYANAEKELYLHSSEGASYGYTAYSTLNQMMIIGRSYSAASQVESACLPGDASKYTFSTSSRPWTGCYLSAAEVNLYLAEFAMLNGNESKAKTYYERGLEFSCQTNDKLAEANQVAYYSNVSGCFTYDPNEVSIDLKDGEVETMLQQPGYAFTGTAAEKLEKIYIQEMLNFTIYPNEVYVTARRSGYPSYNSTLLPRMSYSNISPTAIPRRFPTGAITEDDLTAATRKAGYEAQGLTVTSSGLYNTVLATERLWADKNAPAWGAGQ